MGSSRRRWILQGADCVDGFSSLLLVAPMKVGGGLVWEG